MGRLKKDLCSINDNVLVLKKKIVNGDILTFIDSPVFFNLNNIEEYKSIFLKLKGEGKIINNNFTDSIWRLSDFDYRTKLNFKYESNSELNSAIKAFVLVLIDTNNLKLKTAKDRFSEVIHAIDSTQMFDIRFLDDYIDDLTENFASSGGIAGGVIKFLNFYKVPTGDEYIKNLSYIKDESKVRPLAHYASIVEFDFLIHNFITYANPVEKMRYYILFMWWRLTKIIPMRPGEFTLLEKYCLIKKDNDFYIKVHRSKLKNESITTNLIDVLEEIRIDKETYDIMMYYFNNANYTDDDRFFLSYKTLNSTIQDTHHQKIGYNRKLIPDYIGTHILRHLLKEFYYEIIEKRMGYKVCNKGEIKDDEIIESKVIERMAIGDTRHLAFCSMMLQGFNPLIIAQIGGHRSLSSQLHYESHLHSFVRSHVYILSKQLLQNINCKDEVVKNYFNPRKLLISKLLVKQKKIKNGVQPRSVQEGLCWNEKAPEQDCNYVSCIPCPFYTFDCKNKGVKESILDFNIQQLEENLYQQVELLKTILSNLVMQGKNYSYKDQSDLITVSKSIQTLIAQSAIAKSYHFKGMEIEYEE